MRSLVTAALVLTFVIAFAPPQVFATDQAPLSSDDLDAVATRDVTFDLLFPSANPTIDKNASPGADSEPTSLGQLRKQVELQQRQLQTLERITQLLAAETERLGEEEQAASLDGRAEEAARRDRQLADAVDDLNERLDANERSDAELPANLRELFLPSRTNESPLSIYGTLSTGYRDFEDANSRFTTPIFSPHFYLLLNEQFMLEANPEFQADGTDLESAQLDWFAADHWTFVVGRFYSPLGFFNERIHTAWINKSADRPLMFEQVFPSPLSFNGLMGRGARYLGDSPLKLEYATLVANGLSLEEDAPDAHDFADLHAMAEIDPDVNDSKAIGGRIGLSLPEAGWIIGLSGLANGDYDVAGRNSLTVWDIDASLHRGNWDIRFEIAQTNQETRTGPIVRNGFYAQAAYRPYNDCRPWIQRLEGVIRFDYVRFDGIDLAQTGTGFGGGARVPIDRNRYTFGVNYYPYPSLILKLAYQVSDEVGDTEIADNGVLARVEWGW
jgi:hypothetical protein